MTVLDCLFTQHKVPFLAQWKSEPQSPVFLFGTQLNLLVTCDCIHVEWVLRKIPGFRVTTSESNVKLAWLHERLRLSESSIVTSKKYVNLKGYKHH